MHCEQFSNNLEVTDYINCHIIRAEKTWQGHKYETKDVHWERNLCEVKCTLKKKKYIHHIHSKKFSTARKGSPCLAAHEEKITEIFHGNAGMRCCWTITASFIQFNEFLIKFWFYNTSSACTHMQNNDKNRSLKTVGSTRKFLMFSCLKTIFKFHVHN